jgi:hypothetical protein
MWPDIFFTYDVAFSAQDAYAMECSLFRALGDHTTNVYHPQRVAGDPLCPFCSDTVHAMRASRLRQPSLTA